MKRRTTFAAPFVITIAAGCPSKPKPPPTEQPRSWTVRMVNMKCEALESFRPSPDYKGPPPNPPAPQAVECPAGMASQVVKTIVQEPGKPYCTSDGNVTACPLPYGQALKQPLNIVWLIEKDQVGCHAEELSNCPKGADCNPPKPRYFPCPPGVSEDHPMAVAELPDATCVRVPDGCADTGCAVDKVDCIPTDMKPPPRD